MPHRRRRPCVPVALSVAAALGIKPVHVDVTYNSIGVSYHRNHDDLPITLLRVVRGEPSAEELAALVAVVVARASAPAPVAAPVRSLWGRPVLRTPLSPGPGAWRASGLPR